ncbi:MAG TPA: HEPN domain-containing protein [Anaerolineales bacterium]|nr:HEPN domain-containing protein [Anaerolineales bacterium]
MNPAVAEWVAKAEGDFLTAGRELRARKAPNYDAVCFHAQQCAEKYLKAILQGNEKHIPKIHNLVELMLLSEEIDSSFEMLRADLVTMERYSVRVRYPGNFAEKDEAQSAYAAAGTVRKFIRQKLGLK